MNLADYVPWLGFGFAFGSMVWAVVYCFTAIRRSIAIGSGFYDI